MENMTHPRHAIFGPGKPYCNNYMGPYMHKSEEEGGKM